MQVETRFCEGAVSIANEVSLIACVASVSVRFRSKERGIRHFLVLVSILARSKPKIPFHGLFLLRNQTRGNACYAGYVAYRECLSRELPLFIFSFPKQAGPQQHFLNKGKYIF